MTGLLVLTALLLLAAGLVKLRAAERMGLGIAILPLVEILAGFGMGAMAVARPPSPGGGLVMVILAVALILLSSIQVGLAMQTRRRRRELSEATRLRAFLAMGGSGPMLDPGGEDAGGPEDPARPGLPGRGRTPDS